MVFTEVQPSGTFYDFTTADGWGFIGCDATAHSGTKLIGFEGSDTVTGVITFNPPVSRVILFGGTKAGAVIRVKAFNSAGTALDSASHTAACPMLGAGGGFDSKLAQLEARLTKRLFGFWIAQAATTVGLVFGVVKLVS